MNKPYRPHDEFMILNFKHLEMALQNLGAPGRCEKVQEMIEELKMVNQRLGPKEATYSLVALSAWLTEDGTSSGGD